MTDHAWTRWMAVVAGCLTSTIALADPAETKPEMPPDTQSGDSGPPAIGSIMGSRDRESKPIPVPERPGGAIDALVAHGLTRQPRLELAGSWAGEAPAPRLRWRFPLPLLTDVVTSLHVADDKALWAVGFEQGIPIKRSWIRIVEEGLIEIETGAVHIRPQLGGGYAHDGWSVSGLVGVDSFEGSTTPLASVAAGRDLGKTHFIVEAAKNSIVPWTHTERDVVGLTTGWEIGEGALAIGVFYQSDPNAREGAEDTTGAAATAGWQLPW